MPDDAPSSFTTAPVTPEMREEIFALHEELFRPHIERIWGWHEEWQRQSFARNWEICETLAIRADDGIVGYLQVLRFPDHVFLKNLGLRPAWQGRGIGAVLIKELQVQAAGRGVPIRLSVFVTNPRAKSFYRAKGFENGKRDGEFQHMIWLPKK